MKNNFLFPFLFAGNSDLNSLGQDNTLDLLRYRLLFSSNSDLAGSGKGMKGEPEEFSKLVMLVPIAKNMIDATAKKLASMPDDAKDSIIAAAVLRALSDNILADDPDDELVSALRDVCDECISRFVFAANHQVAQVLRKKQRESPDEDQSLVGAQLVSARKLDEDIVKAIPVEGKIEESEPEEESRAVKTIEKQQQQQQTHKPRKEKKAIKASAPF